MAYGSVKMCLQCATCSMVSTCLFRALKCDVWTLRRGIFSPRFWPGES